jgi:hypothetical protein
MYMHMKTKNYMHVYNQDTYTARVHSAREHNHAHIPIKACEIHTHNKLTIQAVKLIHHIIKWVFHYVCLTFLLMCIRTGT